MGKIRVNKLALELNISNDQIIDELKKQDYAVKNYMSSIDEEIANHIRELFTEKPKGAKKKATKATAKTTKAAAKATKAAPKKKAAEKKAAPKKKSEEEKKTTKTAPSKKAAEKKAAPKTAAKGTAKTTKKKTTSKSKAAPTTDKDKPKASRKVGLKIVKSEDQDKPAEVKKTKEKPAPKEKKKEEKPAPPKVPEPVVEKPKESPAVVEEGFEVVQIGANTAVRDLAETLKCTPNDIIKELMGLGIMATITQSLSFEVASKVADRLGFEVEEMAPEGELGLEFDEDEPDLESDYQSRPPIVTIMGHVDHGKTSLLDAIRKTNVTESEKGGITQHIGAYQAKVKGSSITFLDTPGHEAFTAMRARGAQITDVVVLVVAADDGIKPQTKEAIDHAKAAGVPLVVAINKIDKPEAKPEEVKKQLAELDLLPEEWGGQTIYAEVSAKMNTGIDNLLELLILQAEIMELKSNPKVRARGTVIESKLDKGRGPVATLIVQKGVLRVGDPFIVGNYFGKVRALTNDLGKNTNKATLSMPVEVIGIPEVPTPGDNFIVVKDERRARQLSESRIQRHRESELSQKPRITMEDLHQQIVEGKIQELDLIIKADVQGSIQAVKEALSKQDSDKVRVKPIHDAVGGITESDILLASASNAIIIGFNVRPTEQASIMAAQEKVDIRLYSVIYDAINDIKKAMDGLLEPEFKEKVTGRAEVRQVFHIPKVGNIAGCFVLSGMIERNCQARLLRDNVVVYDGKIDSLKRFKEDVKEVASGYECGLSFEKYQDLKPGDVIEPYILETVAPS